MRKRLPPFTAPVAPMLPDADTSTPSSTFRAVTTPAKGAVMRSYCCSDASRSTFAWAAATLALSALYVENR